MREVYIWVFPKIEVPQNGWYIMEKPIKMDDLGVQCTIIFGNTHIVGILILEIDLAVFLMALRWGGRYVDPTERDRIWGTPCCFLDIISMFIAFIGF